jgi:thymidylate synthase
MHKYENNKDFVCTLAQQFIVNNNKLDTIVFMRSNDLIYGFSYDVPWFNSLQKQIANILKIEVGEYRHFATSMHVYERHFKMVENIAKKY